MSEPNYQEIAGLLRQGGIIAYPTEAVWGLGCDPANEQATLRILELKQREPDKGLILVAADMSQVQPLLDPLQDEQLARLRQSWPGPVTWLIPDPTDLYSPWIRGSHESVAIRVSAHPTVVGICRAFGSPIVSTSANRSDEPEIRSRLKIQQQFGDSIDLVVEGELGHEDKPSEIRDLLSSRQLR